MITKQEMILDFIGRLDTQMIIPVYQRVYAWNKRQCDVLWRDIMRAAETGSVHFIGTVLYAPQTGTGEVAERFDIIDGQQRTATLTLLIAALRDYLQENDLSVGSIDAEELNRRYLYANRDAGANKLVLSRDDRATLTTIVDRTELPDEEDLSENVVNNYQNFREKMEEEDFTPQDAEMLWQGISRLLVISAQVEEDDRAQLIFESLNSKGMPLTTADLIRNLLLVGEDYDEQLRLYGLYWAPIERLFANDPKSVQLNAALHGWLATTAPKLKIGGSGDAVYNAFKVYMRDIHNGSLEHLLIGLKGFCETFAAKAQGAGAGRDAGGFTVNRTEELISERKLFGD